MIPSVMARLLQRGIGDYLDSTYPMTNYPFRESLRKMLKEPRFLSHEPYLAVRLPFRVADEMPDCFRVIEPEFLPYVHQQKAFHRLTGEDPSSSLVATGTGSGKTECFLYPVIEYCYLHRMEKGIKALIIYPMNALASDQARRIAELIWNNSNLRGNVTAGMYVGGYSQSDSRMMTENSIVMDHETMLNNPPDILLTNYKMLDYLLVRPKDAALWQDNGPRTLKFVAVDELHTFDGAQGTDLACLLRRLKSRLGTPRDWLCCVGTSATMGSKANGKDIIHYASEIFGEPFDEDAIITEDRLSSAEFLGGVSPVYSDIPSSSQVEELEKLAEEDNPDRYLRAAVRGWLPGFGEDIGTAAGRIALGRTLMEHSFLQEMLTLTNGEWIQASELADSMLMSWPALRSVEDPVGLVDSLVALVSHARSGNPDHPRPFLTVQVQLWIRELRRLVAKVDGAEVRYALFNELNHQQAKQYLPVVNCRNCGITGWVAQLGTHHEAEVVNLERLYNSYFEGDEHIAMMFPDIDDGRTIPGMVWGTICPECHHVVAGKVDSACPVCGNTPIPIRLPNPVKTTGEKGHKRYRCPCCGSSRGLSLIGMRGATEISAGISQLFASRFNDDGKTLAFSDNVQDAAHKAGFFNSRTYRTGLRSAIQRYCDEAGADTSLADFQDGFVQYWQDRMKPEEFVGRFIAPNMVWMEAYEQMLVSRELKKDQSSEYLIRDVKNRMRYEVMLEYGLFGRFGRSLERCGCSTLAFSADDVKAIAKEVQERCENELSILEDASEEVFQHMTMGWLNILRAGGAFADPVFDGYTRNGTDYLLSNAKVSWLPGRVPGHNVPTFLVRQGASEKKTWFGFITEHSRRHLDWLSGCCPGDFLPDRSEVADLSSCILEAATHRQVVVQVASPGDQTRIFGLNRSKLSVTNRVAGLRCSHCGAMNFVAEEDLPFWEGAPCLNSGCGGTLEPEPQAGKDFFGRLYTAGNLIRVNAREHTGLLQRKDREELERDFKRSRDDQEVWDPNVLSCTPTLEMGIDIGDLSSVILCSMPPAQSQFLQRAGRAGRRDGNALTVTVANARPHDLYYYEQPMEMIAGEVTPPHIFLRASAVLERQFVAFCLDNWVQEMLKSGRTDWNQLLPDQLNLILRQLDAEGRARFPENFLDYITRNLTRLLDRFLALFRDSLDDSAREELELFARGRKGENGTPLQLKILDALRSQKKQLESLIHDVQKLKKMIAELKDKPKDSSFEAEIKELEGERDALLSVIRSIGQKNTFNFLSDEGLIPNYAFPEQGIILRAILYRKQQQTPKARLAASPKAGNRYRKTTIEFSRPAASALSEFAPENTFYADGRQLTIDQVDLFTAQPEFWRLCPECSHARREVEGQAVGACPRCGSVNWADVGQKRRMLNVRMVCSTMDYTKNLIGDDSDDRSVVFYNRQMLVDVDEDHDILSAFEMDNDEFNFGYEFVRSAALREINFGEDDAVGGRLFVSGQENTCKGFSICLHCGKVQKPGKPHEHTYACPIRQAGGGEEDYEDCLFLFREFQTEALRLLIPATDQDDSRVKEESFVAAFMLGMEEYFGNVDHLRATVMTVPVPDADFRKQYLVIYDSVPGGTGYLKQLMHNENALVEIFEKALHVLENCTCRQDPKKDGCYHCLFAWRQSRQIGNISRVVAIRLLKSILSGKDQIKPIRRLSDISVNPLLESELEQRFVEAVRAKLGTGNVSDVIRGTKRAYHLKAGTQIWELEPQVDLRQEDGVAVPSRPDFIFWPIGKTDSLPVAVFTDGFRYHRDIPDEDTLKREAIRRSGRFRVWSLSYKDVQQEFKTQEPYCTEALDSGKMPNGRFYQQLVKKTAGETLAPKSLSSFDLLMAYLKMPDAEQAFQAHALAYGYSLLAPGITSDQTQFAAWARAVEQVQTQTRFTDRSFPAGSTIFGTWMPGKAGDRFAIHAGIPVSEIKERKVSVCAILRDDLETRSKGYEADWNGFWRFWNVMQFAPEFVGVTAKGLSAMRYTSLPHPVPKKKPMPAAPVQDAWSPVLKVYEEARDMGDEEGYRTGCAIVELARKAGIPAPGKDCVGCELEDDNILTELAWPDRKIAYLTEDQMEDRPLLERMGWTVLDQTTISQAAGLFGGEA